LLKTCAFILDFDLVALGSLMLESIQVDGKGVVLDVKSMLRSYSLKPLVL
jgi:hypothetical protein